MISVVIPLYNKAHTIKDTLNSVLNQTYQDFEIIIVNDGSSDKGVQVIKDFSNDDRIRIFDQQNQGVSSARNKGVEIAKYEYIAFLDGDDFWEPEYLSIMVDAITFFPKQDLYLAAGKLNNTETRLRLANKYKNRILKIDFFENPHVFLHTSAAVVARNHFRDSDGFPTELFKNEDYALFFTMALRNKVVYAGYPLSIYNGNVGGQTTSLISYNKEDSLNQVAKRLNYVHENWKKSSRESITYLIFLKYELRHMFMLLINKKEYDKLSFFISKINPEIMNLFSTLEKSILHTKALRFFSVLLIKATKVVWRGHGFPVLGE